MTLEEVKHAFTHETPVTYRGIDYAAVSALIYRKHGGKIIVTAELLDKNRHSVTIATVERVEKTEGSPE